MGVVRGKTSKLSPRKLKLIQKAVRVRERAYAPYSKYQVGAAVEDDLGRTHGGVNVENACFNVGLCAERAAIAKMISRGGKEVRCIAVATPSKDPIFPCGACLQMLAELGRESTVIAVDAEGKNYAEAKLVDLFPQSFTAKELGE